MEEDTVHVEGARRTTADPVSKEAFMQVEPPTDGEFTLATSRPRTSWKSHCQDFAETPEQQAKDGQLSTLEERPILKIAQHQGV